MKDFTRSTRDFSINRRFLIINVVKKMASNGTKYYFLTLKDNTGKLNAKRFTSGEIEFRSLNIIYLIGNFIEIEGIYQYKWQSMKIFTEKLIESVTKTPSAEVQIEPKENILIVLAQLKELIKIGTYIQLKSYINDVIASFFPNFSNRKKKQLNKSFKNEIESWPIENQGDFYIEFTKTLERYEKMQPSKWKKLGSNLLKLLSVIR